jgi:hypothetical protein
MRTLLKAALIATAVMSLPCLGDRSFADDGRDEHHLWKVIDARGQVVGALANMFPDSGDGMSPGVLLNVHGVTVFVPIQRANGADGQTVASQYGWGATLYVNYSSADCSGTPFVIGNQSAALRPSLVVRQGADVTLYIAPDTYSTNVAPSTRSTRFLSDPCIAGTPLNRIEGWIPESSFPLTQYYPEPLTLHD